MADHAATGLEGVANHAATGLEGVADHAATDLEGVADHAATGLEGVADHAATGLGVADHAATGLEGVADHAATYLEGVAANSYHECVPYLVSYKPVCTRLWFEVPYHEGGVHGTSSQLLHVGVKGHTCHCVSVALEMPL